MPVADNGVRFVARERISRDLGRALMARDAIRESIDEYLRALSRTQALAPGRATPRVYRIVGRFGRVVSLKPRVLLRIRDQWRRRGLASFLRNEGFILDSGAPEVLLAEAPQDIEDIRPDLIKLQAKWPSAALLVLVSQLRVRYILPCVSAGALGALTFEDSPTSLVAAIGVVHAGNVWAPRNLMAQAVARVTNWNAKGPAPHSFLFSRAERRVLFALRDDLSNKEIASLLHRSESTIKFHISRMLRTAHVRSRHDLRQLIAGSPPRS